jgi:hypothetical protein
LAGPNQNGASFYLSASDRFVFSVEDERGEPYSLEMRAGHYGIPIAEIIYLSLEAGTDGTRTLMRVSVNGRIIGERELPFPVQFPPFAMGSLGANRRGELNAAFRLYEMAVYEATLGHEDVINMRNYMLNKHLRSA